MRRSTPSRRTATSRVAAAVVLAAVLAGCGAGAGDEVTVPTVPRTTTPAPPTLTMPPTTTPATPAPTAPGGSSGIPGTDTPAGEFRFQPLWPFADVEAAVAWQDDGGASQPWHLDAEETALGFAAALGFGEITEVTSTRFEGDEAWVGVGYRAEGRTNEAAVLHLARIGRGAEENSPGAPWQVVGTEDDVLVLDTPRYGSAASSPVTVGGTITGVDESLRVQVHDAGSGGPLGDACCVPAGGQDAPWETTVSYDGGSGDALTVVAWTGGHVAEVEKFAITALRR